MKFQSEKDRWLSVLLFFIIFFITVSMIYDFVQGNLTQPDVIILLVINVTLPGLISWIWFQTHYTFNDTELIIVSGPLRRKIVLQDITSASLSTNPISSPALSLKRIKISHGKFRTVYISPKDRKHFLSELALKCPNARIGDI